MEDDLGLIGTEHKVQAFLTTDIADNGDELQYRIMFFKFKAEVVHGGLTHVVTNQLLDVELGQLTADFTSDATGCSGYQYGLATQQVADFLHVDMDFISSQKVLDVNTTNGTLCGAIAQFIHIGHYQHPDIQGFTIANQTLFFLLCQFHIGEKDAVNVVSRYNLLQVIFYFCIVYRITSQYKTFLLVTHFDEATYHMVGHVNLASSLSQNHTFFVNAVNEDILLLAISTHLNDIVDIHEEDTETKQCGESDKEISHKEKENTIRENTCKQNDSCKQQFLSHDHEQHAPDFAQGGIADDVSVGTEQSNGSHRSDQRGTTKHHAGVQGYAIIEETGQEKYDRQGGYD